MGESKSSSGIGLLSALMTFAVLTFVAARAHLSAGIGNDLVALLSGRVADIVPGVHDMGAMGLFIVTVIVLELPFAVVTGLAVNALIGGTKGEHAVEEMLGKLTHGHNFAAFFGFVLVEELGARGLFLGAIPWLGNAIPGLSFLSGTAAFYILFLLGNGIWAAIHLPNYKEEGERNPLRVLSQFVGGIFYTYVFVKYGLLAVMLTHFGSNAILFALHRRQKLNRIDALITLSSALCVTITWLLMTKPMSDASVWLRPSPTFVLPGWSVWDYALLSVFVSNCFGLLFSLMLYDRGEAGAATPKKPDEETNEPGFPQLMLVVPLGMMLVVGVLYGLYWSLGLCMSDTPTRVLVVAILFALTQKGASGSAVARTFWGGLPGVFVSMCILEALGFWSALAYLAISGAFNLPELWLSRHDD